MLCRILLIASFLLLAASCGIGEKLDDATYQRLVARVKSGDMSVNFRTLRLSCMHSSRCDARGTKEDLGAMASAEQNHETRKVVEIAEVIIQKGFVNFEAHASASVAYDQLNEPEKAKFHLEVAKALVRSILASGDGRTKESAYEVISDREEWYTLTALRLPYMGPSIPRTQVTSDGPHTYERWEVPNPKTGQKVIVFFNLDAFSPKEPGRRQVAPRPESPFSAVGVGD
jgi:hypothetical protein